MNEELKTLQLFYAGVLADSVYHYGNQNILEKITLEKEKEQAAAAPAQLKHLGIEDIKSLFGKFSRIFGCAAWEVAESDSSAEAVSKTCLLCAVTKRKGAASPCGIYCINPFREFSKVLGYTMSAEETLWDGNKCRFVLTK